jgi:hypothetical protein
MKHNAKRKTQNIRIRITLSEHNTLTRLAVTNNTTISQAVRSLLNFETLADKETGNAEVQPVSGL